MVKDTMVVFPIVQSYKFKSKSQRWINLMLQSYGVPDSSKLQIQKQITTPERHNLEKLEVFPIVQSYKFKSKSQRFVPYRLIWDGCSRQFKVTNSKANHNEHLMIFMAKDGVPDSSKLQIQKQITTIFYHFSFDFEVFPIVQSYKFKSKSQHPPSNLVHTRRCSRQFKVTNSKANHNTDSCLMLPWPGVPDSSKLQIQKQITTFTGT